VEKARETMVAKRQEEASLAASTRVEFDLLADA
jgi:hypothetical protein